MGKLKYIAARLRKMDFGNMGQLAREASERCGKPKALVMLDMIWCGFRYQAGYTDYSLFQMDRANAAQRKTYVTRGVNDRLVSRFNDAGYRHLFENKDEFNARFAPFLGRDWMRIAPPDEAGYDEKAETEKFASFCAGKDEIVAKPRDGMCGKGVEILRVADYADVTQLYAYVQSIGAGVVEGVIVQHPDMAALYTLAEAFAFPTLYEGFGIPVIEAQCCGTPVLTSNTSCLPEVGGDGAVYGTERGVIGFLYEHTGILQLPELPVDELRIVGIQGTGESAPVGQESESAPIVVLIDLVEELDDIQGALHLRYVLVGASVPLEVVDGALVLPGDPVVQADTAVSGRMRSNGEEHVVSGHTLVSCDGVEIGVSP